LTVTGRCRNSFFPLQSINAMGFIEIKPAEACKYDLLSFGEIMLRMDPGPSRIRTARSFDVWEGGGEYNVARGLRRCFGKRTGIVTAFADNEVGRLIEDFILQGGVDTSLVKWIASDGVGRTVRNGLNFTERGFGIRGAVGVPDRGLTAASQIRQDDFDWEEIFGKHGVRWFHTGGIFAALSESTAKAVLKAVQIAAKHGTVVSYDLNYRPSLWRSIGGKEKAKEVNRGIAPYVDVMIGNEEDYTACLGYEVEDLDEEISSIDVGKFKAMINEVVQDYPNLKIAATTLRKVKTATINDWGAICWAGGRFFESAPYPELEIFDRVGGGDSFASGLIYGLMTSGKPDVAINYGTAHGALAMTTPGDTSMATLIEVEKLMKGGGARVVR